MRMRHTGCHRAGPLDEFTRARITTMIRTYFGDLENLDAHIALLDTRGAWYAERAPSPHGQRNSPTRSSVSWPTSSAPSSPDPRCDPTSSNGSPRPT